MDQFSRLELFYHQPLLSQLQNKTVVVAGLGGVGGSCVESLARFGIKTLVIIDHDVFNESNLNRQCGSTYDVLGQKKCDVFKKRIAQLNKFCQVSTLDCFINEETITKLDEFKIDFIVDAIDTVTGKLLLIDYAQKRKIPIVSSCGMGNREDPTQIKVMKLSKTFNDPLAKVLRNEVKHRRLKDYMVVCSIELPKKQNKAVGDSLIFKEKYPIASTPFVVNTAGLVCGAHVIAQLKKEVENGVSKECL